jgi:hypothetical protein
MLRHAKAWAISERCAYETGSCLPSERRKFSMPKHFGNFSSYFVKQALARLEELSSLATTPNTIMRSYTKNGATNSNPDSRSTSCLRIVRNSIPSNEFGSSHVASVYIMFSSHISKRLPIAWRNNLSSGEIRMICSENFVHWHNIYAIIYVAVFSTPAWLLDASGAGYLRRSGKRLPEVKRL